MPIDTTGVRPSARDARPQARGSGRLAVLLAVLLAGLIGAGPAAAQDIRFFRIATGTTGGTYFPIGGLLANAISKPPGSPPCGKGGTCGVPGLIAVANATEGSIDNIAQLRSGETESALVQADIAWLALHGQGPFHGRPALTGLRAIASLYPEAVHLVVRAESTIRSIADLRGRTVSIGEEGSGTIVEARLLLAAYGLSESDLQPVHMKPGPASDRLVEGGLDGFFIVGGTPVAAVSDAAERLPVRLIGIDPAVLARLAGSLPYLTETRIPAGTYKDVAAVATIGINAQWVVRADVDDDLVYGITRALWSPVSHALLANGHPKGAGIRLETAQVGLGVPLHPGAERYYRENPLPVVPPGGQTDSAGAAAAGQ